MDMVDLINDEFGTEYEDETPWTQILAPNTLPRSPQGAAAGECCHKMGESAVILAAFTPAACCRACMPVLVPVLCVRRSTQAGGGWVLRQRSHLHNA